MKKYLFLAVVLACAANSCKKKSTPAAPAYYFKATLDGKAIDFRIYNFASLTYVNSSPVKYHIVGQSSTLPNQGFMIIDLASSNGWPIKTGTYTDTTVNFTVSCLYRVDSTKGYTGGSDVYQGSLTGGAPPVTNHLILSVSMDDRGIKGSFSGDIYRDGSTTADKMVVTNGDFYVAYD